MLKRNDDILSLLLGRHMMRTNPVDFWLLEDPTFWLRNIIGRQ